MAWRGVVWVYVVWCGACVVWWLFLRLFLGNPVSHTKASGGARTALYGAPHFNTGGASEDDLLRVGTFQAPPSYSSVSFNVLSLPSEP